MASNLVRRVLSSIADRGRTFLGSISRTPIEQLCLDLISERGEASGTAIAREITDRYRELNSAQRLRFFEGLLERPWLADPEAILHLAQQYHATPRASELARLFSAAEPRRQELFRRINVSPRGTETIVNMRRDLLAMTVEDARLEAINADLVHLLASWFNRGFLELRRIDWRTPALILEKLIAAETVHEIHGWTDLRRRLASDRRCFAFFHPALPDEPLIFVEVALTQGIATAIQPLIDVTVEPREGLKPDTAVFYSINNCLVGLRSISFGAFLIKQVVQELESEDLRLKNFVTLSPIPGFREWLSLQKPPLAPWEALPRLNGHASPEKIPAMDAADPHREALRSACAMYLTSRRSDGRAIDPVAAFHLNNGASVERINWMGDASEKGWKQSFGLMANYSYRPQRIERNHEQYVKQGRVAVSDDVRKLLEELKPKARGGGNGEKSNKSEKG
jgi:malonyl-CoA decarboxylase